MTMLLKVENMHCQSCVRRVTNAIIGVAPHSKIDIDVDARRVAIDGIDDFSEIAKALAEAGYPARSFA